MLGFIVHNYIIIYDKPYFKLNVHLNVNRHKKNYITFWVTF